MQFVKKKLKNLLNFEIKNVKKEWPVCMCALLLGIQCLLLIYCNLALTTKNIDADSAILFVHAIEMWRNKRVIIPEWFYTTTLELDCSLLLAVPLYGLTKNIYLSFALSNICFTALWIWVLYRLFGWRGKRYPLLCANFILIPYTVGQLDYFNMLFFNGSQYVIKTLLPIMLAALLVRSEKIGNRSKAEKYQQTLLLILYSLFLTISTFSSGIYVLICGIFPVFVGYIIYKCYNHEKRPRFFYMCARLTVVLGMAGYFMNILAAINAKGNEMTLCPVSELSNNCFVNFWGMFELFGGVAYENVPVMSYKGICILVKMGFVGLLLGVALLAVYKIIKRETDIITYMLLFIFVWNFLVISVCDTRYRETCEYRYHLMGMIPLICVAVIEFWKWHQSSDEHCKRKMVMWCCIGVLCFMNFTAYTKMLNDDISVREYQEICNYASEQDVNKVYFLRDTEAANICRLLDSGNSDIVYLSADHTGNSEYRSYIQNYYAKYNSQQIEVDHAMLVLDNTRFDFEEEAELFDHTYHRIQTIDNYSIYR